MCWQQLTGAVMAKGYEDTALYSYNRLTSLNDVGGDPASPGLSVAEFHRWNRVRMKHWPYTLNATSTHDSKRSEDVRARVAVLSEVPGEWTERLNLWTGLNRPKKTAVGGRPAPDANTEYLLYQTLLGAWPMDSTQMPEFKDRLKTYMVKAAREAKTRTSWLEVNEDYEGALLRFIDALMGDGGFLADFLPFQSRLAFYGMLNSLSQVLLKAALPGVPDFYQGNELWDFSLVDPDNRRPVDFTRRDKMLDELMRKTPSTEDLLAGWRDGRIKMYVTYRALQARRENTALFTNGDYRPLYAIGTSQEWVVAFLRRYGESYALAAAPRFFAGLTRGERWPVGEGVWGNDRLVMPRGAPAEWLNVFTGEKVRHDGRSLYLREVFNRFPVALMLSLFP
jgi:(1->4)-alpha-D-glucan 1-alpha-D-glucosylmutase